MAELVLVTGGSGYIAGWCVAELLKRGYDVRTTVRDPERAKSVTAAVSGVVDPAGGCPSPSPTSPPTRAGTQP